VTDTARAVGIATYSGEKILDVWYPDPLSSHHAAVIGLEGSDAERRTERRIVETVVDDLSEPPMGPADAYLRLPLLSHRVFKPQEINVDGIFAALNNVVWTSEGPCDVEGFTETRARLIAGGRRPAVTSVDKFPRMTDYVIPSGVRVADADRVRLGAYLGEGTTVMHEGFVNFNAGTIGPGMIEGRISAGVLVGSGSDLGGGCSTIGTLSGGGNTVISVGEKCLIGANAGIGIPLGDRCTVEAGLFVTAGTKITMLDIDGMPVETAKARDLAGKSDLLFRRNSTTGAVECLTNRSAVELNQELHAHN